MPSPAPGPPLPTWSGAAGRTRPRLRACAGGHRRLGSRSCWRGLHCGCAAEGRGAGVGWGWAPQLLRVPVHLPPPRPSPPPWLLSPPKTRAGCSGEQGWAAGRGRLGFFHPDPLGGPPRLFAPSPPSSTGKPLLLSAGHLGASPRHRSAVGGNPPVGRGLSVCPSIAKGNTPSPQQAA